MAQKTLKGVNKLKKKLKSLQKNVNATIAKEINFGLNKIHRTAIDGMESTPRRADGHSSAGNYPAEQSRDLKKALDVEPATKAKLEGSFGTSLAHGIWIEYGTDSTELKNKRPWLRPSYEKNIKQIKADIQEEIDRTLKKARN